MLNDSAHAKIFPSCLAPIALFSCACATFDSDAERVETAALATTHGVWDPNQYQAPNYKPNASPTPSANPAISPNASSQASSPDPGLYAGDRGFFPWPTCDNNPAMRAPAESAARNIAASIAPEFRACYNQTLQADPNVTGSIRIRATIGPTGHVTSLTAEKVVGLPPAMLSCLGTVVQRRQFLPPCGGAATIVIPLRFATEAPK